VRQRKETHAEEVTRDARVPRRRRPDGGWERVQPRQLHGYSIKLTKGGKKVESLKAGTYKFVITDRSTYHNFTVEREKPSKPKLEKHLTGTAFMGTKTVEMTLKPGSWSFYCSNHEAQMHGDFKVAK